MLANQGCSCECTADIQLHVVHGQGAPYRLPRHVMSSVFHHIVQYLMSDTKEMYIIAFIDKTLHVQHLSLSPLTTAAL